jgi:hypothetical protein
VLKINKKNKNNDSKVNKKFTNFAIHSFVKSKKAESKSAFSLRYAKIMPDEV